MAVTNITSENFHTEVVNAKEMVLIDFWASWCGPCKMLAPIIEEVAMEVSKVKICKINVDDEPQLAIQFNVMTIPTLILMKEGKVYNKSVGVIPKADILKFIGE